MNDTFFYLEQEDLDTLSRYYQNNNWSFAGVARYFKFKMLVAGTKHDVYSTFVFWGANSVNFIICQPSYPSSSEIVRLCIRRSDGYTYLHKIG